MSRFRKIEKRSVPTLNTSSLPDLIFTILFFFMLTTNLKDKPANVKFELPVATQIEEALEDGTLLNIYIGKSLVPQADNKTGPAILVNDSWINVNDLSSFIRKNYPQKDIEVILRADQSTPMGMIIDIKKILQQENLKRIQYIANMPMN